ncbi:MAG: NAD(P)H-dependent flavin oxidoreductase YrpB (nitropropane dioxygenase family), partial [Myxococcota bacterium]
YFAAMSALHTRICDLLGVRYPIVQTGMGWVSGARLTAATSAAGGFGILAAATMTLPELTVAIDKVKSRTDAPFGVNLRADQPDVDDVIALIIDRGIKLASFAGAPRRPLIDQLKTAGILTMPTIGAPRHAEKMQSWGVDAVIAQGGEGGGHTGSIATSQLLPAVTACVDIPVLGAGGFSDGRGLIAALAYGADGIAMGTRFLLTAESQVPDNVKAVYLKTGLRGTVVTRAIDGHPQRVIATELIQELEGAGTVAALSRSLRHALSFRRTVGASVGEFLREGLAMRKTQKLSWPQLAMAANAPMMTRASMVEGRPEVGILPTGQVTGRIDSLPTVAELIGEIMAQAEQTLERLGGHS